MADRRRVSAYPQATGGGPNPVGPTTTRLDGGFDPMDILAMPTADGGVSGSGAPVYVNVENSVSTSASATAINESGPGNVSTGNTRSTGGVPKPGPPKGNKGSKKPEFY